MLPLTENEILKLAESFVEHLDVDLIKPGKIGEYDGDNVEVVFLKTDALDPDVVIDPPDICVWVNTKTKEVTLIYQI